MGAYAPPLREMQFVIEEVLRAPEQWQRWPAHAGLDAATVRQVQEEAGRFAVDVLAPINGPADLSGCHWQAGDVRTPPGYREAYRAYVEAGWPTLVCDEADGGQALPSLLQAGVDEMLAASNHAWTMYPGLLRGAYECLRAYGSEALKSAYLAKIASGEWLATMNLTEPQAGSDLGQLRTRAEAAEDGSYRLTGSKIFISGGEHDLTDNIVHLVLARLQVPGRETPPGSRGISLFLAPKWLPDGRRNAIRCDGIEKKMGIKGSATCAMSFEGATGWLIGEPHRGLAAMFVMMNAARVHVAMQGLGHLESALQNAWAYARERRQGGQRPIVEHAAVRRVLWRLRAQAAAGRVLSYWAASMIDEAEHDPDEACRQRARDALALLTPVLKAGLTEQGHQGADDALQVFGGYGYVHDYGIEQTVRDSRIAMIYEGTNEIQSIDLLQRKVFDDGGQRLSDLLGRLQAEAQALRAGEPALRAEAELVSRSLSAVGEATQGLIAARERQPDWPLCVADDYRRALGLALSGWAWLRILGAAMPRSQEAWHADRMRVARHGLQWLLPELDGLLRRVGDREAALPALDD